VDPSSRSAGSTLPLPLRLQASSQSTGSTAPSLCLTDECVLLPPAPPSSPFYLGVGCLTLPSSHLPAQHAACNSRHQLPTSCPAAGMQAVLTPPGGCLTCAATSNVTTVLNASRYGAVDLLMYAEKAGNYSVAVRYVNGATVGRAAGGAGRAIRTRACRIRG